MRQAVRPPSHAGVEYEEAMRRAHALVPVLRRHADAVEAARSVTPEVLAALRESGLVRMLQPRRWGGMELDYVAHFDVPEVLARGDASSAWTFANLAVHHWMLALWDPRAQEEVWGEDPDVLLAGGIAFAQGRGRRVDGGLVLSGHWNFSSGVDVCAWNMLACIVRDGDTPVDYRYCLVRRSEYEIVDDWHTLGMRGTGSRSVRCEEVFVPEHRAVSMLRARGGADFPGAPANPNPIYRIPMAAIAGHTIAAVCVGNAQAALDATVSAVRARSTSYTGASMRDFQTVQLRIGLAGAKIDAARALLHHDCAEAQAIAAASPAMPDDATKLRFKRNGALGVRLATEAVDLLHEMAGANGIYDGAPLARMFRDAHAAAGHISFNWDTQMTSWGLAALGGEVKIPTL